MKERKLCMICLLLFLIGFFMVHLGGEHFLQECRPSPVEKSVGPGDPILLRGQVYRKEITSDYQILYLNQNSVIYKEQSLQESKIIIYDKDKVNIHIGNKITVEGKAAFFESAGNPGNFDRKLYYRRQNIHVSLWSDKIKVSDTTVWRVRDTLSNIRMQWKELLIRMTGEEHGGILGAMILGDKAGMDPEIKELYQRNGIGHILAISGLHLSFIGVGVYTAFRRATGSYIVGGLLGMTFLCLYILMIGPTVSAVRAVVMFLMRVGADMSGRVYDISTSLSAAAIMVILWRPLSYYDGGFQLSFGAVFGIAILYPIINGDKAKTEGRASKNRREGKTRICTLLKDGMMAGISIQLVTFPIILYHFFEFSVYSIFLNVLVVPLMSVILFVGIAGSVIALFWQAPGSACMAVCGWILEGYEAICKLTIKLPGANAVTGQPALWQIGIYYSCIAFAVACLYRQRKQHNRIGRHGKVAVALALTIGIAAVGSGNLSRLGDVEVVMLDVGQGDSIFMKGPGKSTYLVDGGSSDVRQVGKYRIVPYLKWKGIRELDYVFVSHGDADHMNGIEELLGQANNGAGDITIKHLILPTRHVWDESLTQIALLAKECGTKVLIMEAGQNVREGNLMIRCIQPSDSYAGDIGNESSMVLDVQYKDMRMLLTGDVEERAEEDLQRAIAEQGDGGYQVLKVAHHGSKNSTHESFLAAANPKIALISAGKDNRYGHPHKETVANLEDKQCQIYGTAQCGAVTIHTDGRKMGISVFRKESPH